MQFQIKRLQPTVENTNLFYNSWILKWNIFNTIQIPLCNKTQDAFNYTNYPFQYYLLNNDKIDLRNNNLITETKILFYVYNVSK